MRISQTKAETESKRTVRPGEAFNAEQRFSQVDDWVACLPISGNAKLIYARLWRFAQKSGRAYPSYATLGAYVGLSERQAQRHCHELRDAGLINILRRREVKSKRNLPSVFEFIYRAEMDAVPAGPRPEGLEDEPADISVGRSCEPTDEDGAEPADTCGAEPVDMDVRERNKSSRNKGTRQQQADLELTDSEPDGPAAPAAAEEFPFPKTLEALRERWPTTEANPNHEWAKFLLASGCSDEETSKTILEGGGPWVIKPDAKTPLGVLREVAERVMLDRRFAVPERLRDAANDDSPYSPEPEPEAEAASATGPAPATPPAPEPAAEPIQEQPPARDRWDGAKLRGPGEPAHKCQCSWRYHLADGSTECPFCAEGIPRDKFDAYVRRAHAQGGAGVWDLPDMLATALTPADGARATS